MAFSEATQATLLLTARLAGSRQGGPRPLTATEWGRFAAWLKECSLAPDNLLGEQVSEILRDWVDERVSRERIGALLDRGPALALAADKWQAAGLWVVTRSDTDYPAKLKQRLGRTSPAVLFGAGNRTLLSDGGAGGRGLEERVRRRSALRTFGGTSCRGTGAHADLGRGSRN